MLRKHASLLLLLLSACAGTTAQRVRYDDDTARGLRFYDPMLLLVVTCHNTEVVVVPDLERGYAVESRAVAAKNDFTVKAQEGLLAEVGAKLDSSGPLSIFQGAGTKAVEKGPAFAALGASIGGTIPGMEGIWRFALDGNGRLTGLTPLLRAPDGCGSATGAVRASKAPVKSGR